MGRVHDARWPVRGFSASDYLAADQARTRESTGWWVLRGAGVPKCGVEG
jgi:hypothetical protein